MSSKDTKQAFEQLYKGQVLKNIKLEETQKFTRRQPLTSRVSFPIQGQQRMSQDENVRPNGPNLDTTRHK